MWARSGETEFTALYFERNQNERTNWFCYMYTVFRDLARQSSDKTQLVLSIGLRWHSSVGLPLTNEHCLFGGLLIFSLIRAKGILNQNEVFHRKLQSNYLSRRLEFLSSTCKRQGRSKPSMPAIRYGGKAQVEPSIKPALHFSSSQIHANSSSATHTRRRS